MTSPARLNAIRSTLGKRDLLWFGTRGIDATPLFALRPPRLVVSQIAPLQAHEDVEQDSLEQRMKARVDLDRYDIDFDMNSAARGLKTQLVARASGAAVVIAYRPAEFLTAVGFCDRNLITAFNFHLMQRQFEHKPWVEKLFARYAPSIRLMQIHHVRDTDLLLIRKLLRDGPLVGRTTSSSGGAGVFLIQSENDFVEHVPPHRDGFLSISPFLASATPLNVNACVYADGSVTTFGVSFQLIGVQGLTPRRFGFCGNDFAAAADDLTNEELLEIERTAEEAGRTLAMMGYRGLFGMDLLRHEGRITLIEMNARFQASTALSAHINQTLGWPDPTTEHVAAFLDLPPPTSLPPCAEQTYGARDAAGSTPVAQVFHRNLLVDAVYLDRAPDESGDTIVDAVPAKTTAVERGAILFRSLHRRRVTDDGYSVRPIVSDFAARAHVGF